MPPSTSAGAASSGPTSSGPPASTTASSRRSSSKFLDFIRSYYPGLDAEPPAPRLHGRPPQALPRRRARPRLRHPRPGAARREPASSPSTASRAPGSRRRWRSGRLWRGCWRGGVPSPRPYGERVRVRGRSLLRRSWLLLTPTLSPLKIMGRGSGARPPLTPPWRGRCARGRWRGGARSFASSATCRSRKSRTRSPRTRNRLSPWSWRTTWRP